MFKSREVGHGEGENIKEVILLLGVVQFPHMLILSGIEPRQYLHT